MTTGHTLPRPRVSVLMPTWNRGRFVEEAVRSVLDQEMGDLELVVVDDGSTDDTLRRLEAVRDPRLLVLRREHGGISSALNAGLARARGTWIARLDSDDWWHPDCLASQLEVAARYRDAVAVHARGEAAGPDLTPKGVHRGSPSPVPDDALAGLLMGDFTCNVAVIVRREVAEAVGGWRTDLPYSEDWDFWLRVARHGPFAFNPRSVVLYREHGDNITRTSYAEIPPVRLAILERHFADPALPERVRPLAARAYRRELVAGAMLALDVGDRGAALHRLRQAFRRGDGWLPTLRHTVLSWIARFVVPRADWLGRAHRRLLELRDRRRARHSLPFGEAPERG